jgi:peptidoglycan-N-acetylglucosamine deacetylase
MKDEQKSKTLLISVDLDLWFHCRWATGGPRSKWSSTDAAIKAFYNTANSTGLQQDLDRLVETILEIFNRFSIKATFFILGEMALQNPFIIKKISAAGHEIASHGMHHADATSLNDAALRTWVQDSRKILEDCCSCKISGFRFPNLVYSRREFEMLLSEGFTYDSSVCFSRSLFGKFGVSEKVQNNPYHPDLANPFKPGKAGFWEIPIPVFPLLRLPGGSGIATRLLGSTWSRIALDHAFRSGDAMYYFHPFDLHYVKGLGKTSINARLFLRNCGGTFKGGLENLLQNYRKKVRCTCVRDWLADL